MIHWSCVLGSLDHLHCILSDTPNNDELVLLESSLGQPLHLAAIVGAVDLSQLLIERNDNVSYNNVHCVLYNSSYDNLIITCNCYFRFYMYLYFLFNQSLTQWNLPIFQLSSIIHYYYFLILFLARVYNVVFRLSILLIRLV